MNGNLELTQEWFRKAGHDLLNAYAVDIRYPDDAMEITLEDAQEAKGLPPLSGVCGSRRVAARTADRPDTRDYDRKPRQFAFGAAVA